MFHLEDYKIMQDGIRHLLSAGNEEMVGEAKTNGKLFSLLEKISADVLFMDLYRDDRG